MLVHSSISGAIIVIAITAVGLLPLGLLCYHVLFLFLSSICHIGLLDGAWVELDVAALHLSSFSRVFLCHVFIH